MIVKQIIITCDFCNSTSNMRLDWSEFKLPEGWQFRTRSFSDDDKPEQVQFRCKDCKK